MACLESTADAKAAPCPRGPHADVADAAMSAIRGTTAAQRLLFTIAQGCAPADLLLEGIEHARAMGDRKYLRAFVREIAKRLEHTA